MILFFPVTPYFFLAYYLKLILQGWPFFFHLILSFLSLGVLIFVCCFSILPLSL